MQARTSHRASQGLVGRSGVSKPLRTAVAKKRPVACQRCHIQKIKCSGGTPCSRCVLASCEIQCTYVVRDRKIRVEESYLERLIEENKELHQYKLGLTGTTLRDIESSAGTSAPIYRPAPNGTDTRNPVMKDRPWFQSHNEPALPIFVSEVACTAFATRLCQWLTGDDTSTSHIPRIQYTTESTLNMLSHAETAWPSHSRARLLVNTALGHANPIFHLTLRRHTVDYLQTIYQNSKFNDPVLLCKYFALFALGEVCSVPTAQHDNTMPGTAYYARAVSLIPVLPERPNMAHIEALLILSLYSQFLNRWHTAYTMIGTALRLGLSAGLNHNIPPDQCPDSIARENRVRVWWTIYNFDRFWSLKLGLPVQVDDCDVHVDLPSDTGVVSHHDQFTDSSYQVALTKLARVASKIMRSIYSRTTPVENFLQREQKILIDLKQWLEGLPAHLRLQTSGNNPNPTISIHLQFNYCVVLAIRPILLSMLDHLATAQSPETTIPPVLSTLSEACIGSARHTLMLCADAWTKGSLPVYGYAFAQYIFTSSLVLVISSLLPCGIPKDHEYIETASEILRCLVSNGCLVAHDLSIHLQRVRDCLEQSRFRFSSKLLSSNTHLSHPQIYSPSMLVGTPQPGTSQPGDTQSKSPYPQLYSMPEPDSALDSSFPTTPNMALDQPMMQDILGQSVLDIDLLQPLEFPEGDGLINPYLSLPLWDNSGI